MFCFLFFLSFVYGCYKPTKILNKTKWVTAQTDVFPQTAASPVMCFDMTPLYPTQIKPLFQLVPWMHRSYDWMKGPDFFCCHSEHLNTQGALMSHRPVPLWWSGRWRRLSAGPSACWAPWAGSTGRRCWRGWWNALGLGYPLCSRASRSCGSPETEGSQRHSLLYCFHVGIKSQNT